MTEITFAKQFLTSLDSKPNKLSADHVEDPRNYPARSAYILPKMPNPLPKRRKLAPGAERSLSVTLKSLRNPPLDITLSSLPPTTSILDLKNAVTAQTSLTVDKLRILHKKKPVPDSKVLKDLVGEEETQVEFNVMVLGGAGAKKDEEVIPPVAQGASGKEELKTEEFWTDLNGFLTQRLRDEGEAEKVFGVFRKAWEAKK